jgi:hypothetical protein
VGSGCFGLVVGTGTSGGCTAVMPPTPGFVGGWRRIGLLLVRLFMVEPVPSGFAFVLGAGSLGFLGGDSGNGAHNGEKECTAQPEK